jgi:hypothetical protein
VWKCDPPPKDDCLRTKVIAACNESQRKGDVDGSRIHAHQAAACVEVVKNPSRNHASAASYESKARIEI